MRRLTENMVYGAGAREDQTQGINTEGESNPFVGKIFSGLGGGKMYHRNEGKRRKELGEDCRMAVSEQPSLLVTVAIIITAT